MKSEVSTVTAKGQLVIPAKLRHKYGIRKGTRVAFCEENGRLVIQPITEDFIRGLCGSLKGKPSALDYWMREHRREREL